MKTYEDKRTILCDMAELYLDSKDTGYVEINDGELRPTDIDSKNFLLLMALTFPNDGSNYLAHGLNIDQETQNDFVNKEFEKIMSLKCDIVQKGKIVLQDAYDYFNNKYDDISYEEIEEIAKKLYNMGIRI